MFLSINICKADLEPLPVVLREWAGFAGKTDSTFVTPIATYDGKTFVASSVLNVATGADIRIVLYQDEVLWQYDWSGSGIGRDQATDIALDTVNGRVYVCGTTYNSSANDFDFVTICLDFDGHFLWSRTFNGTASLYDVATAIVVHDTDVYVTGVTFSMGTFLDYHTIRYDSSGALVWDRTFDYNSLMDIPFDMSWSEDVNAIVVTGGSQSAFQEWDYQTLVYADDGTLNDQYRIGGSGAGFDRAQAVVVDDSGYIYLTGETFNSTNYDIKTAKFTKYGVLVWVYTYDSGNEDLASDLIVDYRGNDAGELFVCGTSNDDFFVTKYSTVDGTEIWKTYIDGAGTPDSAKAMCFDSYGNIVVTGQLANPLTKDYDFFTVCFDREGNELWRDYFDGPYHGDDNATNISADNYGSVFVTGQVSCPEGLQTVTIKYNTNYFLSPPAVDTPSAAYLFYPNEGQLVDVNDSSITDSTHYYTLHHYPQLYFGFGVMNMVWNHIDEDTATIDTLQRVDVSFLNSTNVTEAYPVDEDTSSYLNYFLAQCPEGITNVHGNRSLVYTNVWSDIDVIYSSNNAGLKMTFVCNPGSNPQEIGLLFQGQDGLVIDQNWYLQVQTALGNYEFAKPRVYQLDSVGNRVQVNWQLSWDVLQTDEALFAGWGFYNNSLPLYIEIGPQALNHTSANGNMFWSSYIGYNNNLGGVANQIIKDASENTYLVGKYSGILFPSTSGTYQSIGHNSNSDVILIKMNPTGNASTQTNIEWSTFYGSNGNDDGLGVAINNSTNDLWIAGLAEQNLVVPSSTSNFHHSTYFGNTDGFIARFNNSGTQLLYASYIGGSEEDICNCIDINQNDQTVYVCGSTTTNSASTVTFQDLQTSTYTDSYNQTQYAGPTSGVSNLAFGDGFIMRFSNTVSAGITTNDLLWSTYFGGEKGDRINSIEILDDYKVIISGTTESSTSANPSPAGQPCLANSNSQFPDCDPGGNRYYDGSFNGGGSDCFVAAFNSNDQLIWSTYYGGSGLDGQLIGGNALSTTYTPSQTFYMVGRTSSTSNFVTGTGYNPSFAGMNDAFVARFNGFDRIWSSYFGGQNDDEARGVTVDDDSRVYITGTSAPSTNVISPVIGNICSPPATGEFPICNSIGGYYTQSPGGGKDAFIASFDNSNHLIWSSYLGGNNTSNENEEGYSLVAGVGNLYLCGISGANSGFPYPTAFQTNYYNQSTPSQTTMGDDNIDIFVTVFNISTLTGINEINDLNNELIIFPNPANDFINLSLEINSHNINDKIFVEIFDVAGRLMEKIQLKNGNKSNFNSLVHLEKYMSGIYFLKIQTEEKLIVGELIKQ